MHVPFHLDLRVNRRKTGLSQRDVAHLMGVHPSKISLLETKKGNPNLRDLAALSIVFGKTFEEGLFGFLREAHRSISNRLRTMPEAPRRWLTKFNRQYTLDDLAERLAASHDHYEAA